MYKNILVPVDPAHEEKQLAALAMARRLAEDASSEITAITVIEPVPSYMAGELPADVAKAWKERAMDTLRHLAGDRSEIKTVILHGRAGHEIVDYARQNDIDCIVIASHKPELSDYLLGSTAGRVVRHAPCSVHVMR